VPIAYQGKPRSPHVFATRHGEFVDINLFVDGHEGVARFVIGETFVFRQGFVVHIQISGGKGRP
jgi:hypothetical protein